MLRFKIVFALCIGNVIYNERSRKVSNAIVHRFFYSPFWVFFLAIHCGLRLPEHSFQSQGTFLIRNAYELSNVLLH